MKNLNHYVAIYKEQLEKGDILVAYYQLVKFVSKLRVDFKKNLSEHYTFTGILHGYLDYTYFYYTNEYLKSKKLKLGLVLNHVGMRFEIWLLGNTIDIQKEYWNLLQDSEWNKGIKEMPKYSILQAVIEADPDFDNLALLSNKIERITIQESTKIIRAIKKLK